MKRFACCLLISFIFCIGVFNIYKGYCYNAGLLLFDYSHLVSSYGADSFSYMFTKFLDTYVGIDIVYATLGGAFCIIAGYCLHKICSNAGAR